MPNPVRAMRQSDFAKMSVRQKAIVRQNRRMGLPTKVYHRAGGHRGLSVHSPMLDVKRTAKVGSPYSTKKYPQARDTTLQRGLRHVSGRVKGSRRVSRSSAKRFLLP